MNGYDGVQDINQLAQMKQLEEMKRRLMNRILSKEAFERLGRVRSVNPELASQAEIYLLQLFQSGRVSGTVSDEEMKEILKNLSEKRDISIKRR